MNVYLDSSNPENRTDALALHAARLDSTRNGLPVPVVTASEFQRFISAWSANDRNGLWNASGVIAHNDGTLTYWDGEGDDPEEWLEVGTDEHGNALYAITGWVWEL